MTPKTTASTGTFETVEPVESIEPADADLVTEDLLVEDVSIDGLCGVY
jgi:mycofactocin precursor